MSTIYNNLANVYGNRGDTTLMVAYYEKALVEAQINNKLTKSLILNNLGNTLVHQKQFKQGYEYIMYSLRLKKGLNDVKGLSQCYRNLGYYFYKINKLDSAAYYFNSSIEAATKVGSVKELMDSREGLAKIYEDRNDSDRALIEFKTFKELSDSLYNEARLSEISRIESKYEFDKEQAILIAQQKKKELQLYIIVSILIGLTIILDCSLLCSEIE